MAYADEMPQFQLMIKTIYIDKDQNLLEKGLNSNFFVKSLAPSSKPFQISINTITYMSSNKLEISRKRFKEAAEEAQVIIDLFLSALHFRNRRLSPDSDVFKTSLALENVTRSIDLKTQSAAAAAGTSCTRKHLVTKKPLEEKIVGLDRDSELIRDRLAEDTKQLRIVSIVGMGGIGKTTMAIKLFNDCFVVYHFRDFLIQILTSIGVQEGLEETRDYQLRGKFHKHLTGKRYLIVIDDICSIEAWDDLKMFFPHDNTGSRIQLTSRLNEVALHAKPHGETKLGVIARPERMPGNTSFKLPPFTSSLERVLSLSRRLPGRLQDECKKVDMVIGGAEGFIEEAGNQSLEDVAKAYLMDTIDRNLVVVAERKFNGDVKACKNPRSCEGTMPRKSERRKILS
ncbi:Disease resistance protein [Cynara cardunculus var. scolymus]|uniref:Disease resistance protein n=1 Tax=Cynara cardunculus var. scolymus TaxID=59895 RepID=A0A124SFR3_CYNCS|nr:Disease resistance protein [Cynara cardunculus var. scolymus]